MFTRVLSEHEYKMWNHPNPDVQRWWRYRWFENLAQTAMLQGVYEYETRAPDERVLHRGEAKRPGDVW